MPGREALPMVLRILLVDDDPGDRLLVRQTLAEAHVAVSLTELADQPALESALEGPAPDLVLTDYALGWTSGLAVLLRVKSRWPDVPVIMVTGTGSEEIAVECMREGLDDYILKSSRHILRLPAAIQAAQARVEERRARRTAENRYASLFAGVPIGLYRAAPTGEVLEANPAFLRILACPDRADLSSTCLFDLCDAPEEQSLWRSLAWGERDRLDVELRLRRWDGATVWVENHSRVVRDVAGQVLFAEGSLEDISSRKQAEAELMRQHEELHILAARLTEVEETERQRLARELHDQVGQNLTALGIGLSLVRSQLPKRTDPAMHARLADLLGLVEETTARIRSVMGDLRPPVLDDYGLVAALGWYAGQVARRTGISVDVSGKECDPRLPPAAETALFRIAQEALNNVAKHAGASRVGITFSARPSGATLAIADNGKGFAATMPVPMANRAHWGLRIMKERADGVGGACRIESRPDQGTRVTVEVPR